MMGKAGRREKAWEPDIPRSTYLSGECRTMPHRRSLLLAGLAALLGPAAVRAADPAPAPPGPAYQIVLRSRHAEVTPTRTKDAQTGGGGVVVEQPEPTSILVTMGG